jgi:hypothetical protein
VSYSTQISAPGPIFWKPPGLSQNRCRWYFMRFLLIFDHSVHIASLLLVILLPFLADNYLLKRKSEGHISSLTVPPPCTDHSLRHSNTKVGLWARRVRILFFRENVYSGAHGFWHSGQFFGNLPDCHKILVDDILWGFHWILDHRVRVPALLRVISLPFVADNYLLKWKSEWHISLVTVPPPCTDQSFKA